MPEPVAIITDIRRNLILLNDRHRVAKLVLLELHPDLTAEIEAITHDLHQIIERIHDKLTDLIDVLEIPDP